jgi:uncharacterized protein
MYKNQVRVVKKSFLIKRWQILLILLSVTALPVGLLYFDQQNSDSQKMESEFGKYQGYSAVLYDGSRRSSDFLTLSDGTRLAYDLFLPTRKGIPADKALPTLFKYTPYDRAWTIIDQNGGINLNVSGILPWYYGPMGWVRSKLMPNGNIMNALSRTEWLGRMVNTGYAVIVMDRPGTGASFGTLSVGPEAGARECNEILNWIAAQPWSDGNIGMFGDSIQAQVQFQAASTGNPHLKAILPATTWMDNYSAVVFPGGVLNKSFTNLYSKVNKLFDSLATPVDQDKNGSLLAQARAERSNASTLSKGVKTMEQYPFRDSPLPSGETLWVDNQSLYPLLDKINRSGVPVYLIDGWYDIYARDDFLIYNNMTVPKRLMIRPRDHSEIEAAGGDIDYGAEAQRWFDYWLKGIDNGIMAEPPIHYYLQGVDSQSAWKAADAWPLKQQTITRYYLGTSNTGQRVSTNSGSLVPDLIESSQLFDTYTVDYSTTTGNSPHWTGLATPHQYPNMRSNDAKALTYTTPELKAGLQVSGHPIAHLWLRSTAPDLDTFVYLEEVDQNGNSTYITQGNLRASHRILSPAPFDNFGLPWHNHFQNELEPIPAGEPFELVFDLLPTAWHFSSDKSMRITVTFADAGNFDTPIIEPAPTVQLLRDAEHLSYVEIPVIGKEN